MNKKTKKLSKTKNKKKKKEKERLWKKGKVCWYPQWDLRASSSSFLF
jgi:hypothetical protein